ncbi:hypothetical protein GCM10023094_44720 [Rhodococcus olei]|uniref:SOS response associated peptidase (SRAP) n=1 Tax=Rhodococcus olei TaxID=2161675 RepID=A0ABP8PG93_9NOCA
MCDTYRHIYFAGFEADVKIRDPGVMHGRVRAMKMVSTHRSATPWPASDPEPVVKIPDVLRPPHHQSMPLLPIARTWGRRETWPSERLERLLTQREVDDLVRGHFTR